MMLSSTNRIKTVFISMLVAYAPVFAGEIWDRDFINLPTNYELIIRYDTVIHTNKTAITSPNFGASNAEHFVLNVPVSSVDQTFPAGTIFKIVRVGHATGSVISDLTTCERKFEDYPSEHITGEIPFVYRLADLKLESDLFYCTFKIGGAPNSSPRFTSYGWAIITPKDNSKIQLVLESFKGYSDPTGKNSKMDVPTLNGLKTYFDLQPAN